MNHCWTLGTIQHHQLEEIPGTVGAEYEVADGIFGNFLYDQGMAERMVYVGRNDSVAVCRPENLHPRIVLRNSCLAEGISRPGRVSKSRSGGWVVRRASPRTLGGRSWWVHHQLNRVKPPRGMFAGASG